MCVTATRDPTAPGKITALIRVGAWGFQQQDNPAREAAQILQEVQVRMVDLEDLLVGLGNFV